MLSTLLAAVHHTTDVDLGGLLVCLLVGLLIGAIVCLILRAVGVRSADLIGLCVGGLVALACWF